MRRKENVPVRSPIFTTLSHNIELHRMVTTFQNPEWHEPVSKSPIKVAGHPGVMAIH